MDFSQPQSSLSLGFNSHASSSPISTTAEDSVSFQIDSSFLNQSCSSSPVPLRFVDKKCENSKDETCEEQEGDKEFRLLGHSMGLKRKRDSQSSSSSSSNHSKRVLVEPGLEARRSMVQSWGNQPLRVADPDVFGIMEKENKRQFKGIELIASENFVCKRMQTLSYKLTIQKPHVCKIPNQKLIPYIDDDGDLKLDI